MAIVFKNNAFFIFRLNLEKKKTENTFNMFEKYEDVAANKLKNNSKSCENKCKIFIFYTIKNFAGQSFLIFDFRNKPCRPK